MELYTKSANETHTPGNEKYVKTHKPQTPAANSTARLVHYAVEQKTNKQKKCTLRDPKLKKKKKQFIQVNDTENTEVA